ncbi:MAG: HEAT repeat domain-containing protein, partial [Verrucomicrobiota bacterium]
LTALADKDPAVREHGIQLAEPRLSKSSPLAAQVLELANDENARVRFQCALTLGESQNSKVIAALAKIAKRDAKDRWALAAVLSSINGRANHFLDALLPTATTVSRREPNSGDDLALLPLMNELGKILGADNTNSLLSTLHTITSSTNERDFDWQLALLSGFAEGLRSSRGNTGDQSALMNLVTPDSPRISQRIDEMMNRAAKIALDATQQTERRRVAAGLLSHADFSRAAEVLDQSLNADQPSDLQIAAVRSLGQIPAVGAGALLVRKEHWNGYTPAVRDVVLGTMMAQTNLVQALFAAVEKGDVPPWSINPERRNILMKHKDDAIRNRAAALFKDLHSDDRMKVYEEYKSVLALKPDAANGHAVFTRTCTSCHVFAGEGKAVGPDLTGIRNQPADVLLLHILVPEFEIMPIYSAYNIETKDGQSLSGLLAAESPSNVTLRQALGIEQVIPRSNLASISPSRLSLMPQELEKTMSKQDLADLIGFLKGGEAK